jgi:hypothetical protein
MGPLQPEQSTGWIAEDRQRGRRSGTTAWDLEPLLTTAGKDATDEADPSDDQRLVAGI